MNHFETLGFAVEKIYLENKFLFENVKREPLERISRLIKKRYQIRSLNFTKTKELLPYIDEMFDLFNESYASLTSFVPISNEEKFYLIDKYIQHINPEYIKFVLDKNGKIIAFAVIMLSYAQALQKANGSLFPFGFFHLLKAKKQAKMLFSISLASIPLIKKKGYTLYFFWTSRILVNKMVLKIVLEHLNLSKMFQLPPFGKISTPLLTKNVVPIKKTSQQLLRGFKK